MLRNLIYAGVLLAACVLVHALTLTTLMRRVGRSRALARLRFWPSTWLLIEIAWWIVLAHVLEIAIWAVFFWWKGVFDGFEPALYFSFATYATVGYGDVVADVRWRSFAAVEGLVGILMCGWSAGAFFAIVSRMYPVVSDEPTTGHR